MPAGRIFLSYRRQDTRHAAGRLFDQMSKHYGRLGEVFMDVSTVKPGEDYGTAIEREVASSDVLIALIGPGWLTAGDVRGPRLANEHDWVRREIRTAMDRGITVIPVLVDGATMPTVDDLPPDLSTFARRTAARIEHERFTRDVEQLIDTIDGELDARASKPARHRRSPPESPHRDAQQDGGTRHREVPVHRSVLLAVFCVLSFVLTLLFAVGLGAKLAGKLQSLGGSVSAAIALFGVLAGLCLLSVWGEVENQRRMLSKAQPADRPPWLSRAAVRAGFLGLGGLAVLWFLLAWFA